MNFGQRLKNLRLEQNITQQELADAVGVSAVTVRNWERGTKKPAMEAIIALARELKITTDGLLDVNTFGIKRRSIILSPAEKKQLKTYQALDEHGKKAVDMICTLEKERLDASEKKVFAKKTEFVPKRTRERFIPRYTTPSAAGYNVPLDGTDFEMMLVDGSVPADADYAVDIQGNSMYPYINDGDMVYVKKDEELSNGDVGIFCVDGAMYCKQMYIDEERNLTLVSANPDLRHTNIYVSADSEVSVKVCGKVLLGRRIDLPDYIFDEDED